MRLVQVLLVVGVTLGGCDTPVEQQRRDVCTAYCGCVETGLPSAVERCITDDCLPDLPPVSDACMECVYQHSQRCPDLFDECTNLCLSNAVPLLGGM